MLFGLIGPSFGLFSLVVTSTTHTGLEHPTSDYLTVSWFRMYCIGGPLS